MSEKHIKQYLADCHAMQSGVALDIATKGENAAAVTPKHLRVGVNTAMCDHAALVHLLISKGIIVGDEYEAAIAEGMKREVARYEKELGLPPGSLR